MPNVFLKPKKNNGSKFSKFIFLDDDNKPDNSRIRYDVDFYLQKNQIKDVIDFIVSNCASDSNYKYHVETERGLCTDAIKGIFSEIKGSGNSKYTLTSVGVAALRKDNGYFGNIEIEFLDNSTGRMDGGQKRFQERFCVNIHLKPSGRKNPDIVGALSKVLGGYNQDLLKAKEKIKSVQSLTLENFDSKGYKVAPGSKRYYQAYLEANKSTSDSSVSSDSEGEKKGFSEDGFSFKNLLEKEVKVVTGVFENKKSQELKSDTSTLHT